MGWSKKYKRSIDCNNPKGFSQKAHCAGRKKQESKMSLKLEELVGKSLTEAQFDEAAGKKDACYHKVKARYDVWPSAYASGALVKCRKAGAKNWGNKSKKESVDEKVNPEMKKVYQLLIKYGNNAKDAMNMIKKNLKYVDKTYRNSSARDKAMALVGLSSLGESKMELSKIKDAILMFQKKIKKQGMVTNARDEEHLKSLIKVYKQMGGKGVKEGLGDKFSKKLSKFNKKNQKSRDAMKKYAKLKKKESVDEARGTCWVGYQQKGMKDKGGKMVPNCVKEITEIYYEVDGKAYGYTFEHINDGKLNEAEYQGRKVKLGKPMQGDAKKFKVYVKNPKGNVVKVNFGQGGDAKGGTMKIRKSNPGARKSFRARHNCDSPGPRHKARYWSCRKW